VTFSIFFKAVIQAWVLSSESSFFLLSPLYFNYFPYFINTSDKPGLCELKRDRVVLMNLTCVFPATTELILLMLKDGSASVNWFGDICAQVELQRVKLRCGHTLDSLGLATAFSDTPGNSNLYWFVGGCNLSSTQSQEN
jgi:hypothetical protein